MLSFFFYQSSCSAWLTMRILLPVLTFLIALNSAFSIILFEERFEGMCTKLNTRSPLVNFASFFFFITLCSRILIVVLVVGFDVFYFLWFCFGVWKFKDGWKDRWVLSDWKRSEGKAGTFKYTAGKWAADPNDRGNFFCFFSLFNFISSQDSGSFGAFLLVICAFVLLRSWSNRYFMYLKIHLFCLWMILRLDYQT